MKIAGAMNDRPKAAAPNAASTPIPIPTFAQFISANSWKALPVINIAVPRAISTPAPIKYFGLDIAFKPFPNPVKRP